MYTTLGNDYSVADSFTAVAWLLLMNTVDQLLIRLLLLFGALLLRTTDQLSLLFGVLLLRTTDRLSLLFCVLLLRTTNRFSLLFGVPLND